MNSHYNNIAETFNKNWGFTEKYKKWMISNIINLLDLNDNDIFIDIGAGTGLYTKLIEEKIKFKNKILFVEPSLDMANLAKINEKFLVFNENSSDFFKRKIHFDKILFKEVIHHIDNRNELWQNLYNSLNSKGKFLIITRPQNIKIPLFNKAKEEFKRNQPDYIDLINEAKLYNFNVKFSLDNISFQVSKEKWYQMLKDRFMSDLSTFSDEEIRNGIAEIENEITGNTVNIIDEIVFIIGIKNQ